MISRPAPGMLPEEAVVLQVTGPFGAPAQKAGDRASLSEVGGGPQEKLVGVYFGLGSEFCWVFVGVLGGVGRFSLAWLL